MLHSRVTIVSRTRHKGTFLSNRKTGGLLIIIVKLIQTINCCLGQFQLIWLLSVGSITCYSPHPQGNIMHQSLVYNYFILYAHFHLYHDYNFTDCFKLTEVAGTSGSTGITRTPGGTTGTNGGTGITRTTVGTSGTTGGTSGATGGTSGATGGTSGATGGSQSGMDWTTSYT